jgi:glutamate/tyrosine decarboxylase-like PLP-dependent enzyme
MESQTSLPDVVKALQDILSSPRLGLSHHDGKGVVETPVLPQHVPVVRTPNIETSLSTSASDHDKSDASLTKLTEHLTTAVLPYLNRGSLSPNYYGFVIGGATPAALLGDFLAAVYDQNVHVHLPTETIATALEVATLNMLVQLFRLPQPEWSIGMSKSNGGGIFTTGATASNVLGLALGREYVVRRALQRKGIGGDDADDALSCGEHGLVELMLQAGVKKIQVLSTLPHSSIVKAAGIIGIGRRNVASIATSHDPLQIDFDRLRAEASQPDVLNILAVSTGEVNTGRFATDSLDQWRQLRQICDAHDIWIHVDGAFGLFGRLFGPDDGTEYKHIVQGVQGLELADSITGDCHKLLNVPYDSGVFFTRHKQLMEDVFRNGSAAYLRASATGFDDGYGAIQTPLNIGIENSRRFRALPAYATLLAYGRQGYLDMLKRQIGLARRVTSWLLRDERFEVLPATAATASEQDVLARTYMVVLFRVKDEQKMKTFVQRVKETGKIYVSGTVWEGKEAARIAVSNWRADVERDGELIENVLDEMVK